LESSAGRFLFASNEAARFFALSSADGGAAFGAASLATDEWLGWEERVLQPVVAPLAQAVAKGTVSFPIPPFLVNSTAVAFDERAPVLGLLAAAAESGKAAKKPKLAAAPAAVPEAVLDAYRTAASALSRIEQALYTQPFLSGSYPGVSDWVVSANLPLLLPLFDGAAFPATRQYYSRLSAVPSIAAGLAHLAGLEKLFLAQLDTVDPSVSVHGELTRLFTDAILGLYPALKSSSFTSASISLNIARQFLHQYQCNDAMAVFKTLKTLGVPAASPFAVAEAVAAAVPKSALVGRLEVAKAGFINIYLDSRYLSARMTSIAKEGLKPPSVPKQRVLVDYSSPNIAKEMHVGHLRSTIIGDAICRVLEFLGHEVLRVNHVGDWGTQFGMLIAHIKDAYPSYETRLPDISDLTKLYKDAKKRFDAEPDFKARSHDNVVKLQAGDPMNVSLWKRICDISAQMFNEVYTRLGIDSRLELCGESFYNPMLPSVIAELEGKKLITNSDGASVFFTEEGKPPLIVRKGDGAIGYDSTDLAAVRYRLLDLHCNRVIYVVDSGQSLHFELLFAGAKLAGWVTPSNKVEHVAFGVVQGSDKKKFKTRDGSTVRLVDLLDEARDKMKQGLLARAGEGVSQLSPADMDSAAAAIGYGGVKYFDLRQNRLSDYEFSYDRMLNPDGDTAVYLEYAHARLSSILRKAAEVGVDVEALKESAVISLKHHSEVALASEIVRLQEVVLEVEQDLLPSRVCEFLYKVSVKFSEFNRDCRVIGSPEQDERVLLCLATLNTIRTAFALVGIQPVDRL